MDLIALLKKRPDLTTCPVAMRLAALLHLEDMVRDGLTLAEAHRRIRKEGVNLAYSTCQDYVRSRGLAGKVNENFRDHQRQRFLAAGGIPKSSTNDRGPLHPYKKRYSLLKTATAYCIVDRMSERFSTPREWREWIISDFPLRQRYKAMKEVNRLNTEWARKLRAKNPNS